MWGKYLQIQWLLFIAIFCRYSGFEVSNPLLQPSLCHNKLLQSIVLPFGNPTPVLGQYIKFLCCLVIQINTFRFKTITRNSFMYTAILKPATFLFGTARIYRIFTYVFIYSLLVCFGCYICIMLTEIALITRCSLLVTVFQIVHYNQQIVYLCLTLSMLSD